MADLKDRPAPIDVLLSELEIALFGKDGNTWESGRLAAVCAVLLKATAFGASAAHERAAALASPGVPTYPKLNAAGRQAWDDGYAAGKRDAASPGVPAALRVLVECIENQLGHCVIYGPSDALRDNVRKLAIMVAVPSAGPAPTEDQ